MALLKRADVRAPVLPKETVEVAELGGEVIVRGLLLAEKMARNKLDGGHMVAHTLACAVELEDGGPLFGVEEWAVWGSQHADAALMLFKKAQSLSGDDPETNRKN